MVSGGEVDALENYLFKIDRVSDDGKTVFARYSYA
jgi:hypothetical protein